MAIEQHQIRTAESQNMYAIERNIIINDSLLPSADELSKLAQIDVSIVKWLMDKADIEQEIRKKVTLEGITLAKNSMWIAFSIILLAMAISVIFALVGNEYLGIAFSVISVIVFVQAFLRFGRNQKQ
ncbi:MAG: hypothetical protein FWE23_05505 [Chitinivibrionia bacterium]|nr:hypothetical protein [Chitinivibrionia bacterium]